MKPQQSQMPRAKVAIVLTRDLVSDSGRPGTIRKILKTLAQDNDTTLFRLHTLLETRAFADFVAAGVAWLISLLRGRPMPLQCLLYASRSQTRRLIAQIRGGGFSVVYLDMVRCETLLRALRGALPGTFIVTDFDDLISRRMQFLSAHKLPLLTGHAAASFPGWLRRLVEGPLARLVAGYEAATLSRVEIELAQLSDTVILVSASEAATLRARLPISVRARILTIPPFATLRAAPWRGRPSLRFIFIGSDRLLQNRLAIDYLLERWRALRPATTLHIYGAQTRLSQEGANVRWHGFAADLAQVYQPGSIALVPALISGGIKTKIAEAWSYGCPVLGNETAFEGLAIENYPLNLPEASWDRLLIDPPAHGELWIRAAQMGQDFVGRALSPERFHRAWARAISPSDRAALRNQAEEVLALALPGR